MANPKHLLPFFLCLLVMAADGSSRTPTTDCRVHPSELTICRPAVTGADPPQPTSECCKVVKNSNLACLCRFKDLLPAFGIDPPHALALPKKCGLQTPPECKSN
ncbi:Putative lipid-transfer protein DIR1 [Linum grandiflorum]